MLFHIFCINRNSVWVCAYLQIEVSKTAKVAFAQPQDMSILRQNALLRYCKYCIRKNDSHLKSPRLLPAFLFSHSFFYGYCRLRWLYFLLDSPFLLSCFSHSSAFSQDKEVVLYVYLIEILRILPLFKLTNVSGRVFFFIVDFSCLIG